MRNSSGTGLVIALITLFVTGILAAAAASVMKTLLRDSVYQERLLEAQAAAESGTEDALGMLARDGSWRDGFLGKPFMDGYYDVALTSGAISTLTSTGYSRPLAVFGRARRTLRWKVRILPVPQMPYAAMARDTLFFAAGRSWADSYNSEAGLDPARFESRAEVLTNKNMDLAGKGVVVLGNAAYKTNPAPPPSSVSGRLSQSNNDYPMPGEDGSAFLNDNDNRTGIEPAAAYDSLRKRLWVPWNSVATIRSGVYYLTELKIEGILRAKLTEGPVVIFLNGPFTLAGTFENDSRIPANLILYGQGLGLGWNLAGPKPLYAVLHAPTRDLIFNQTVYGAVAGRAISLLNGALHYDASLQRPRTYIVRME